MARKVVKHTISKGERLGWTSLDKVKSVTLSSIVVKGRRVVPAHDVINNEQQTAASYLIP